MSKEFSARPQEIIIKKKKKVGAQISLVEKVYLSAWSDFRRKRE